MQRKVTSKLLLALVLLSVVISIIPVTQTLAAENEYALDEVMPLSYSDNQEFYKELYIEGSLWGVSHQIEIDVNYNISYDYEDGAWSYITNLEIHINGVYIDGEPYGFSSKNIEVNSSSGYRDILVNDSAMVRVGISVDEYGEIYTYAETL